MRGVKQVLALSEKFNERVESRLMCSCGLSCVFYKYVFMYRAQFIGN